MAGQPLQQLTTDDLKAVIKAANAKPPTSVDKTIMWVTKWSPEQLKKITDAIGQVQSILGAFSSINAAYNTVMSILEMVGILKAADPFAEVRAQIAALRDEMRQHFKDLADQHQMDRRNEWSAAVEQAEIALSNLKNSPESADNQKSVKDAFVAVEKSLFEMLNPQLVSAFNATVPAAGNVEFDQSAYGWPPTAYSNPPNHWVPYATSPGMVRNIADPSRNQINYWQPDGENRANLANLNTRIWDPSWYYDVLVTSLAYYVSLLTAIEPAFRATAHYRKELLDLSNLVGNFVDAWRSFFLLTQVDYYLPPNAYGNKSYPVNPFGDPYLPQNAEGVPLCVVDPLSGMMFMEPLWKEGFVYSYESPPYPIQGQPAKVLTNTFEAGLKAKQAIADAIELVEASSGIATLEKIQAQLKELGEYGLYGSTFSHIEPAAKAGPSLIGPLSSVYSFGSVATEYITLEPVAGIHGFGKKYRAHRYYDPNGKRFRLPIVRRMQSSGIQLGYKLLISIVGSNESRTVTLVDFNRPTLENENPPIWPSAPSPFDIVTEHATLYDVVQDAHFSSADEDNWERGIVDPNKNRLFIHPRSGKASVHVDITLELDVAHDAYIGFANVLVTNLDENPKDAFIVHIAAYEMANTYSSYMPSTDEYIVDHQEWISAGDLTIHMVPTYLIVEDAYFEDRVQRLALITKSIRDALHTVEIVTPPWGKPGGGPQWRVRDAVEAESHLLARFHQLSRDHPTALEAAVARYAAPDIIERPSHSG
jgi:hypothetical protein